jgi:Zn-dependent metalloprotease
VRTQILAVPLLATALLVLAPTAGAQSAASLQRQLGPGVRVSASSQTGQVRFVGTAAGNPIARPAGVPAGASAATLARTFLDRYGDAFGIADQARDLRVTATEDASRGRSSVRFQQLHDGVPVLGGELVVNLDAGDNVLSANGETLPPTKLVTTPQIDAAAARAAAITAIAKHDGIPAGDLHASTPELWIYDSRLLGGPGLGRPELVWRTEVTSTGTRQIRELVLVDAGTGGVVLHFDQIQTALNRSVCDQANVRLDEPPCTAPVRSEGQGPTGHPDVNSAYDLSGVTYDFYAALGRDSLDGAGLPLRSTVRYCAPTGSCPLDNAFWNGSQMYYGESYASADDVVGHELTHGVTDFTSGLYYYYQSGAINESLSDVMGELVDLGNVTAADTSAVRWQIGEDLPIGAIRNMSNPPAFGDPDRTGSANYQLGTTEADNGGVHTNSGVNNKAAFLITDGGVFNGHTIVGIGTDKAKRIYYEVDAHLLTSAGDYQDLFDLLQQACTNLVGTAGITAADCTQVREAVLATEMNLTPARAPATDAPLCTSGAPTSTLFSDDLESGDGNWVGADSGTWFFPPPDSQIYATSGTNNFFGFDADQTSDFAVAMAAPVVLPSNAFLYFRHAYGFEDNAAGTAFFDGGVLEYSTNGGASWNDGGALFVDNGYDGPLSTSFGNPLGGRLAFGGESNGYISSRLNLAGLAGQSVRFRFRLATDEDVADRGWFIDDILIYTCQGDGGGGGGGGETPTPTPTTPIPTPTPTPIPDTTKPTVALSGSTRVKAGKTIAVSFTPNEAVTATLTGSVSVRRSARGKAKSFKLTGITNRAIAANTKVTLKLKVPSKTLAAIRSALRRRGGKATVKITIRARDAAGNVTTATRSITLRR